MTVDHLNETNFDEIVNNDGPVIVDFWAEWCMPCRMMAPVFEDLSREFNGRLRFAKLNTDEYPEIASRYSISGIPCLIVMKSGEEMERIVGFAPKEAMKEKISRILERVK